MQITKACAFLLLGEENYSDRLGLKSLLEHVTTSCFLGAREIKSQKSSQNQPAVQNSRSLKAANEAKLKLIALKRVRINLSIFHRTFSWSLHCIFIEGKMMMERFIFPRFTPILSIMSEMSTGIDRNDMKYFLRKFFKIFFGQMTVSITSCQLIS